MEAHSVARLPLVGAERRSLHHVPATDAEALPLDRLYLRRMPGVTPLTEVRWRVSSAFASDDERYLLLPGSLELRNGQGSSAERRICKEHLAGLETADHNEMVDATEPNRDNSRD